MDTLRELLRARRPLESFLPAFTSNPAALLRLPRKGRIAEGMDADLVVLDAEAGVHDVMAGGRWHVRAGEQVVRGTFE
jgi:beta-aspartyl-dipeptidase (metallo-type)